MISRRERAQPFLRAQLSGRKPEPAILLLQLRDLLIQRRKPITLAGQFEANHQSREADDRDQRAKNSRHQFRRPASWFGPRAQFALRSIHRIRALRARGLRAVSAAEGFITLREIATYPPPPTSSRKRSFRSEEHTSELQ